MSGSANSAPGAGQLITYSISQNNSGPISEDVTSSSASSARSYGYVAPGVMRGIATAQAGTFIDNDFTYGANAGAIVQGSFRDGITFTGTPGTQVQIRIGMRVTGDLVTSGLNSSAAVQYNLTAMSGAIRHNRAINNGNSTLSLNQIQPFIITGTVGQTIPLNGNFRLDAGASASRPGGSWVIGSSSASFGNTFITTLEVLTPGGGYTTDSGAVYAVPEPMSASVLGLGALALLRRRRKNAA